MDTPIADFVSRYNKENRIRLHMPGHKGRSFLGCEHLDITEISGADDLYEASGIIAQSETNATELFRSGQTFYATEGSSQCIRAMLYLALTHRPQGTPPLVVAARNVHKAFVYAAALLDFEVVWLWPDEAGPLCGCPVSAETLERTLTGLSAPPAAVYLTSPDYLGGMADISAMSAVCHRYGTILAVDNAHGAYLRFLEPNRHPLALGADICCDSAHKTLPVLTGGAYLHVANRAPASFVEHAKGALAMFGSTSPSYLTLLSLDLCNRYLAADYPSRLAETVRSLDLLRIKLIRVGWKLETADPLRLTIAAPTGLTGRMLAEKLRRQRIECEYADPDFLVLMATPENRLEDWHRVGSALGENHVSYGKRSPLPLAKSEPVLTIRQALFAAHEKIPIEQALGRICGAPTVSCPPAIPIVVSGERIDSEALALFAHYGFRTVSVLR